MTDTVWIDINHIDGNFVLHEGEESDKFFRPVQFHFHSPSEHTIDGRHYDLEMHFYHETADGLHHTVITVFFDTKIKGGVHNDFIENIFQTPKNDDLEDKP